MPRTAQLALRLPGVLVVVVLVVVVVAMVAMKVAGPVVIPRRILAVVVMLNV
jgi:hypothetical protein